MNTKQKQRVRKWIAALRSGEFKQAKERLYDKDCDGHCCLGVARNILKNSSCQVNATKSNKMLTRESFERAFGNELQPSTLAGMNDNGQTFSQIADYIEGIVNNS